MERENNEERDKYLFLFTPEVDEHQSNIFCCCSIIKGNQFIAIIMLLLCILNFYNSLYATTKYATFYLLSCLINGASGLFLLLSTFNENYIYVKIPYVLYEITFLCKILIYFFMFLTTFILIFDNIYNIFALIAVVLWGAIDLSLMSYILYVMYCFLIVTKFYNNDLNRVGAEYIELLKDDTDLHEAY